jgi:hypothetical protein
LQNESRTMQVREQLLVSPAVCGTSFTMRAHSKTNVGDAIQPLEGDPQISA